MMVNNSKINKVQKTIDILLEMIDKEEIENFSIPRYMIPIIDDSLKLYDENTLTNELKEEINNFDEALYDELIDNVTSDYCEGEFIPNFHD